ncbi:transcription termination/antitermination protein NusG [Pseudoroseomonas cervicalis]|uniref:transcription termination/antitermination protein NusG n=1 Tax=Teichococcus cervicalis TaxID=204525 RepID=UPI0022F1DA79|nr:transcription termination/antitermination NusG family protein [Pseudoroseomonas cervicalis]WBV42744.1 hypothetical protein PFY06_16090 [Pseudoroseomonas cervicalis]
MTTLTSHAAQRRRGRPPSFPVPLRQLLDGARREAVELAFGAQSGDLKHLDCGSLSEGQRWFCVQTHAGQERRAAQELRQQDFVAFLPVAIRTSRTSRSARFTVRPELPRYLFVGFDPRRSQWRRIFSTYGVARLFCFGDWTPAAVRRGDVERLIDLTRTEIGQVTAGDDGALQAGDRCTILSGPFARFSAMVVGEAEGKIRITVQIFGRESQLLMEPADLRRDRC